MVPSWLSSGLVSLWAGDMFIPLMLHGTEHRTDFYAEHQISSPALLRSQWLPLQMRRQQRHGESLPEMTGRTPEHRQSSYQTCAAGSYLGSGCGRSPVTRGWTKPPSSTTTLLRWALPPTKIYPSHFLWPRRREFTFPWACNLREPRVH